MKKDGEGEEKTLSGEEGGHHRRVMEFIRHLLLRTSDKAAVA